MVMMGPHHVYTYDAITGKPHGRFVIPFASQIEYLVGVQGEELLVTQEDRVVKHVTIAGIAKRTVFF